MCVCIIFIFFFIFAQFSFWERAARPDLHFAYASVHATSEGNRGGMESEREKEEEGEVKQERGEQRALMIGSHTHAFF